MRKLFKPKLWEPFIFENNKIPIWLSKIAPINIFAISLFIFIFCKETLTTKYKLHEIIHFQQQLELFFIGFLILYGLFYIIGYLKYKNGQEAYYQNPFEKEAFDNQNTINYLINRKRFSWIKYLKN